MPLRRRMRVSGTARGRAQSLRHTSPRFIEPSAGSRVASRTAFLGFPICHPSAIARAVSLNKIELKAKGPGTAPDIVQANPSRADRQVFRMCNSRFVVTLVLALCAAVELHAGAPLSSGTILLTRGGSSRSMFRRMQQMQQQSLKSQAQLQSQMLAQQKAQAEAEEKKRHQRHEAAASASRDLKKRAQDRIERTRQREAELHTSPASHGKSGSASTTSNTARSTESTQPKATATTGASSGTDTNPSTKR